MWNMWKHSQNRCVCFDFTKMAPEVKVETLFVDVIFFHMPKILPAPTPMHTTTDDMINRIQMTISTVEGALHPRQKLK